MVLEILGPPGNKYSDCELTFPGHRCRVAPPPHVTECWDIKWYPKRSRVLFDSNGRRKCPFFLLPTFRWTTVLQVDWDGSRLQCFEGSLSSIANSWSVCCTTLWSLFALFLVLLTYTMRNKKYHAQIGSNAKRKGCFRDDKLFS